MKNNHKESYTAIRKWIFLVPLTTPVTLGRLDIKFLWASVVVLYFYFCTEQPKMGKKWDYMCNVTSKIM